MADKNELIRQISKEFALSPEMVLQSLTLIHTLSEIQQPLNVHIELRPESKDREGAQRESFIFAANFIEECRTSLEKINDLFHSKPELYEHDSLSQIYHTLNHVVSCPMSETFLNQLIAQAYDMQFYIDNVLVDTTVDLSDTQRKYLEILQSKWAKLEHFFISPAK